MHKPDSSCWELAKCTAEALDNDLASTYWNQGRWKKVEVLEGLGLVFGEEHPDTLTSMAANLASTYQQQGPWKESEVLPVLEVETRQQVCRAFDTYKSSNKPVSSRSLRYRQILYLILSNCFCSKSLLTQYQNVHPTHHLSRLIYQHTSNGKSPTYQFWSWRRGSRYVVPSMHTNHRINLCLLDP